jgi:hypothetical protein
MMTREMALAAERKVEATAAAYSAAESRLWVVGKGTPLRVVRGRKVPVGTRGRCIWIGETKYGTRVGLAPEGAEAVFTARGNVEVDVEGDVAADLYDLHLDVLAAKAAVDALWAPAAA